MASPACTATLQILSDLHLESPKAYDLFPIIPRAPHLALLGDIGNVIPHKQDLLAFLIQQLKQFRAVLFVPGNHEAYSSDWPTALAALRTFEEEVRSNSALGKFILLERAQCGAQEGSPVAECPSRGARTV